jgi:hypothetical protein
LRNKLHARVIPAIAAALGGVAMVGIAALPASASPTAATTTARASARMIPQTWYVYSTYPTYAACRTAGWSKVSSEGALSFRCKEITDGDFFVWQLSLLS